LKVVGTQQLSSCAPSIDIALIVGQLAFNVSSTIGHYFFPRTLVVGALLTHKINGIYLLSGPAYANNPYCHHIAYTSSYHIFIA
jgi:hypothetical protein